MRHSKFVVEHRDRADDELTIVLSLSYREAQVALLNIGHLAAAGSIMGDPVAPVAAVADALRDACRAHREAVALEETERS